jgi:hypothetical protein
MFSRCLAIAAVLTLATAVAAEPPRPAASESAKPATPPAPVMLASADRIQTPPAAVRAQASVPAKRPRAARVTTCRCGGQSADQQDFSEDQ